MDVIASKRCFAIVMNIFYLSLFASTDYFPVIPYSQTKFFIMVNICY